MPAVTTWQQHRLRWILVAIGVVIVALLVALAVHVYALLQPARFTSLIEHELAGAGIRLTLQQPAEPRLFPRPAVRLQAFSLTSIGSRSPVLQAEGATIVVPWRALLHGEAAIERIEVDAPRIDLGQLRALMARLPHRAGPPQLPTIATGVHMSGGTLSDNGAPLLFELSLDTGELVPGRPFRMDLAGRSASGRSLTATLTTVPSDVRGNVIDFDPIDFSVAKQGGMSMQLQGRGSWSGGENLALQLHGTLRHPALTPPAPSAPVTAAPATAAPATSAPAASAAAAPAVATDQITLGIEPARDSAPLTVAVGLDGDDAHADFRVQPTEFAAWWQRLLAAAPDHPPGPLPFIGKAAVQKLDLGWLRATGLKIDAGPDLAPASSSSAAPAAAASTSR